MNIEKLIFTKFSQSNWLTELKKEIEETGEELSIKVDVRNPDLISLEDFKKNMCFVEGNNGDSRDFRSSCTPRLNNKITNLLLKLRSRFSFNDSGKTEQQNSIGNRYVSYTINIEAPLLKVRRAEVVFSFYDILRRWESRSGFSDLNSSCIKKKIERNKKIYFEYLNLLVEIEFFIYSTKYLFLAIELFHEYLDTENLRIQLEVLRNKLTFLYNHSSIDYFYNISMKLLLHTSCIKDNSKFPYNKILKYLIEHRELLLNCS